MTAIVGVLCRDGVIIGTDEAYTLTTYTPKGPASVIEQLSKNKIEIIENSIILAGTGEVGLNQRFSEIIKRAYDNKLFSGSGKASHLEIAKELSKQAIEDFSYSHAQLGSYGALLAFPFNKKPYLCEFALKDFQPEFKMADQIWFCSMGSTQVITDPFLAFMRGIFWSEGPPTLEEAILVVVWTIQHAIDVNPGGVKGIPQVAILEAVQGQFRARKLEEIDEHLQRIEEAKEHFRKFPLVIEPGATEEPPSVDQAVPHSRD